MSIAIISGASSGIGKEFTKVFAQEQLYEEIWIIARTKQALESLQAENPQQKIRIFCLDLAKESNYRIIQEALEEKQPEIGLLINCAGFGKICYFEKTDYQAQLDMIKVNNLALTALTFLSLKYMTKGSKIMNIASVAAFLPLPKFAVYSATKAYTMYFSRALNRELKKKGIHVLSVHPAPVKTAFFPNANKEKIPNLYDLMPRVSSKKVVKKSLKALNKNKEVCVVGYFSNTLRVTAKLLPTSLCLKVLEKL